MYVKIKRKILQYFQMKTKGTPHIKFLRIKKIATIFFLYITRINLEAEMT